jgi:hypothetical protein
MAIASRHDSRVRRAKLLKQWVVRLIVVVLLLSFTNSRNLEYC